MEAVRLRKELQEVFGITPEVRPGWPSQFVVEADGERIFTRWGFGRMPRAGEIVEKLKDAFD